MPHKALAEYARPRESESPESPHESHNFTRRRCLEPESLIFSCAERQGRCAGAVVRIPDRAFSGLCGRTHKKEPPRLTIAYDKSIVIGKKKWNDIVVMRSTLHLNKSTCFYKPHPQLTFLEILGKVGRCSMNSCQGSKIGSSL